MSNLQQIITRAEQGAASIDDGLFILARMQAEIDRLKDLAADLPAKPALLVKVDGTVIKFENEQALANWIVGAWEKTT